MAEKINLKFEEIRELAKELQEVGRTMFLVKHNAISVDDNGNWAVKHYEGLKLSLQEAMPGHIYETDVPYVFWQEVLRQVDYYLFKKEERAKAQAEALKPKENEQSTN